MKALVGACIGIAMLASLYGCRGGDKPSIVSQDDLELAHVCLNRVFTLEDNSKLFGILPIAGDRIATYRTGPFVVTAYVSLRDVELQETVGEDGQRVLTVLCPAIEIKGGYEKWEARELRFQSINEDEGRKPFTANEIQKKETEAVEEMKKILANKAGNPIIQDLIKEARQSARENIPLLLRGTEGMDNIVVRFKDEQNEN